MNPVYQGSNKYVMSDGDEWVASFQLYPSAPDHHKEYSSVPSFPYTTRKQVFSGLSLQPRAPFISLRDEKVHPHQALMLSSRFRTNFASFRI